MACRYVSHGNASHEPLALAAAAAAADDDDDDGGGGGGDCGAGSYRSRMHVFICKLRATRDAFSGLKFALWVRLYLNVVVIYTRNHLFQCACLDIVYFLLR